MINNNEIINGERKSPLIWLILFVSHPIALFFEIWKQFFNPFFAREKGIYTNSERERERDNYIVFSGWLKMETVAMKTIIDQLRSVTICTRFYRRFICTPVPRINSLSMVVINHELFHDANTVHLVASC